MIGLLYMSLSPCVLQVFCDFPPGLLFLNPKAIAAQQILGDGGFGVVSKGTVDNGVSVLINLCSIVREDCMYT